MGKSLNPEDLSSVALVSNPSIVRGGERVLFTVSRISLERDRYESGIWQLDLRTLEKEPLEDGVWDRCPNPAPDGRHYSFISRRTLKEDSKGSELWVSKLGGRPRLVAVFDNNVDSVSWAPNSREIALIAVEGRIDDDVKIVDRIDLWFNGEGFTYSLHRILYVLDVESGMRLRITGPEIRVLSASWSPDGSYIAYTASRDPARPYMHELHIYKVSTGEDVKIDDGITTSGIAWSPDSSMIAVLGHRRERGSSTHNRIMIYKTSGEKIDDARGLLDRNPANTINSDVRGPSCSKNVVWGDDGKIYTLISDSGEVYLISYTPSKRSFENVLRIPRASVDEFSLFSGDLIAATVMTATEPKEIYLKKGDEVVKASSFNHLFKRTYELVEPEHFVVKASDGELLDAWIMVPRNPGNGRIPGILYIHGGPKTMYGWSFIYEFHYLVSRGFALIYSNPRGSDGYSEDFADIRGRYGERDYQDLMEVVDEALRRYPFLDPERLGVTGGSYGGFMTNWIVTSTSRFKAAVTQRSISDWISMFGTTDIGHYFVPDQIGCIPWENPEKCLEKSPLRHAGKVRTPTLIIHSLEDYRCWVDQAIAFFRALKLNGVETRLVLFPKENHELSRSGRPRHRVENMKHISSWFEKYLGSSRGALGGS